MATKFEVGRTVVWRSQAQGLWKMKVGKIVEVVPQGERPSRQRFEILYKGAGVGFSRKHESYVVMVGSRPYWPRVSALKIMEEEDDGEMPEVRQAPSKGE